MKLSTVADWLSYLQDVNQGAAIKLGLERVRLALAKLDLPPFKCPVVTVAGTNGKGSTVKGIEHIFCHAHYQVASFTSPALFSFNEQIRFNEEPVDDLTILDAFERVSKLNEELTPFEFQTLAALTIFSALPLDLLILEVGLGGRLDAVNIIDTDIAVITSIGIDHTEFLGTTREAIAKEKAGILRKNKPAVIGDFDIPESIYQVAKEKGAILYRQGYEFEYNVGENTWSWQCKKPTKQEQLNELPIPKLAFQNLSTVLMVVNLLQEKLPVQKKVIYEAIQNIFLPGRIQVVFDEVMTILDVSHNEDSVAMLANFLKTHPIKGKRIAVFSMFADKNIKKCIDNIGPEITEWWIASLHHERRAPLKLLKELLKEKGAIVHTANSIAEAFKNAKKQSTTEDCIVVFGSFHTVKEAMEK